MNPVIEATLIIASTHHDWVKHLLIDWSIWSDCEIDQITVGTFFWSVSASSLFRPSERSGLFSENSWSHSEISIIKSGCDRSSVNDFWFERGPCLSSSFWLFLTVSSCLGGSSFNQMFNSSNSPGPLHWPLSICKRCMLQQLAWRRGGTLCSLWSSEGNCVVGRGAQPLWKFGLGFPKPS